MPWNRHLGNKGISLLEVIAILVVIGILATIAITRFPADTYSLPMLVDKIKLQLRYAQTNSMNTDAIWGIRFSGNTYFLVRRDGVTSTPVILPGEETTILNLPPGVTLNQDVAFDNWGRPAASLSGVPIATSDIILNISNRTIIITRNTGFIP